MMGVGKSTIGKKLAQKLKLKFVDIDRVIQEKEKSKIKDIFQKKGENYFLTIKGKNIGISRLEYDFPISKKDAEELMLHFCKTRLISKTRHYVAHNGHTWEVDEFHSSNDGLIVAEIELKTEDENFDIPNWIGKEVTKDAKYYNMNLAMHPYTSW